MREPALYPILAFLFTEDLCNRLPLQLTGLIGGAYMYKVLAVL